MLLLQDMKVLSQWLRLVVVLPYYLMSLFNIAQLTAKSLIFTYPFRLNRLSLVFVSNINAYKNLCSMLFGNCFLNSNKR